MIIKPRIQIHRLILSLSQALDYVHPAIVDHQQRVAYIALSIARQVGMDNPKQMNLFFAAALHDIGLVGVENRINGLHKDKWEQIDWHAEAGFALLNRIPLFARSAQAIRYHHTPWANGKGCEHDGNRIPFASHIISLADSVERMIDRNNYVLDQSEQIRGEIMSKSGSVFNPDCVNAFCEIADTEAFWLDCVSPGVYDILLRQTDASGLTADDKLLESIAEIFSVVIDATSQWTATHSAGVSATAVALAQRFHFSPREQSLMKIAGLVHDLGKLTVPTEILDKPGSLTQHQKHILNGHTYHTFQFLNTIGSIPQITEWASFHHERLDGNGYPFHHAAKDLTLGSRIMAVADVFCALTENRPYHKAMSPEKVVVIMNKLAGSNGLDRDIVSALMSDYAGICNTCQTNRNNYADTQRHLANILHLPASNQA